MKLLLTSSGLTNDSIIGALRELTGHPFEELKLAFIPTAANLEKGDKRWIISDLKDCETAGFAEIDIVDISALPKSVWQKRLETADVIFVSGGNTFHLMHWVRASGLAELLPALLETRVYVGVSAGSMIAAPSIHPAFAEKGEAEEVHGTIDETGLSLIDFLIEPHINSSYFPELTFEYVQKESTETNLPIYALDDQSAIKVVGGEAAVISEGEWKKFN